MIFVGGSPSKSAPPFQNPPHGPDIIHASIWSICTNQCIRANKVINKCGKWHSISIFHSMMCVCLLVFHVSHLLSKRKFRKNYRELNPRCLHELPIHYHLSHSVLSIRGIILPQRKNDTEMDKTGKGICPFETQHYFHWRPHKKELIFYKKNFVGRESNPGPLR